MKNYRTTPSSTPARVVAGRPGSATSSNGISPKPVSFTHEQISARARALWEERGRPLDQDDVIWLEAERRLKAGDEKAFADPKALLNNDNDPSSRLEDRLRDEVTPPERRSPTSL